MAAGCMVELCARTVELCARTVEPCARTRLALWSPHYFMPRRTPEFHAPHSLALKADHVYAYMHPIVIVPSLSLPNILCSSYHLYLCMSSRHRSIQNDILVLHICFDSITK